MLHPRKLAALAVPLTAAVSVSVAHADGPKSLQDKDRLDGGPGRNRSCDGGGQRGDRVERCEV